MRKLFSWWPDGPVAAGVLLTIGVVLAFAPDVFIAMLARSFLWQWAITFFILAAYGLLRGRWWTSAASLGACALTLFPPMVPERTVGADKGAPGLRVAQMNVFQPNGDHAGVLRAAMATGADILSFQEVSPQWAAALADGLSEKYPFHRIMPGTNCYGIALFSRLPFERAEVIRLSRGPAVDAVVRTDRGLVRVLCVHATSPGGFDDFLARNEQLDLLPALIASSDLPTVLINLNTVSWDHAFRRLCARSGLHERSGAVTATWPSIAGLALIPIDHVLVSDALAVSDLRTFTIPGSDHRGLFAQLVPAI